MNLRDGSGKIDVDAVARAAGRLLGYGVGRLVVIHYPEGACAISAGGDECRTDSFTVPASRVVSSVGAGDAFCAGCLFSIHQGYPLRRMLDFASACARFNLFSSTSTGGAPSLGTVEKFLSDR